MASFAQWEKSLLPLVVWREARGEGKEGMAAVLNVIANRVKQGKGWAEVICSKNQFSSMSVLGDSQTVAWPNHADQRFLDSLALVEQLDSLPDATGGATFYWNPQTATSQWFAEAVQNGKLKRTVSIGHHDFFVESHA
jgi:N-acetylmuramoyl-L-alanine amidase